MPRMLEVSAEEVKKAGYKYNSSVNPTFLPGRYNKLHVSKRFFNENGLWQIPAAVSWFRFPLFWLSFHNLPLWLYRFLLKRSVKSIGYAALYFHPWEFYALKEHPEYKMPFIIKNHSGEALSARLDRFIKAMKRDHQPFATFKTFVDQQRKNND